MSSTRGLADHHRLEAALERGVLLDVLAVLVERGGADGAQLAAREHRLQEVRGVHRALGRAGADDGVQLVHEEDHLALGLGDLLQHRLEAVLELAAVLRAGDQRADVERDHAPVAERLGHVAGDDPLREPLDDGGLADAGLADQDRVVLGAPRQDLDHAPDLLVAADHRVELALLGRIREVAAEALEGLVALLGVLVGHAVRPADLLDRLEQLVARGARVDLGGAREGEQQVLGRDVLVAEPARLVVGLAEQVDQLAAERGGRVRVAGDRGQRVERLVGQAADPLGIRAGAAQDRRHDAALLLEQGDQEVMGRDLAVAARGRQPLSGCQRLLGLDCEAICLHKT